MNSNAPFCIKRYKTMLLSAAITTAVGILVLLSDSIISGFLINEKAVAALTVINPIYLLLTFLSLMVTTGLEIIFPYEVGKMNLQRANEFFSMSCIISLFLGILFFFFILFFSELFFSYMGIGGEVLEYARAYISIIKWVYLIIPISETIGLMVYVDGDELVSNISSIYLIIGNIGSSLTLTYFFGISGVAYGTLIGYLGHLIISVLHFFRKTCSLKFSWYFSFKDLMHLSKFSIVDSILFFLMGIVSFVVQKIILSNYGDEYIPAFSVMITVIELSYVFDCVGSATSPILSVFRGENNSVGIKSIFISSVKTALLIGFIAGVIVFFAAPLFPMLYGIESSEIYDISVKAVRIVSLSMFPISFLYIITSYYLSIEKIALSTFITVLRDLIPNLVCVFIFNKIFKMTGIWIGFAVGPWIAVVISFVLVKLIYKNQNFPYLIQNRDSDIFSWSFYIDDKASTEISQKAAEIMKKRNINPKSIIKVSLLIEEGLLLIKEKNPDKKVYAECTIFFEEKIKVIFRDDGIIFDMTDANSEVSSFRSFFVSSLMEHYSDKAHLITTSYDRNVFGETVVSKSVIEI